MGTPKLSIAAFMVVTGFVAVDLVALGPLVASGHSFFGERSDPFFDVSISPLVLILQVSLVATVNLRGRIRPALVGFQAAGWVAVAIFLGVCSVPGLMIWLLDGVGWKLQAAGFNVAALNRFAKLAIFALIVMGPPWSFALAGGGIAALVAPRRRAAS